MPYKSYAGAKSVERKADNTTGAYGQDEEAERRRHNRRTLEQYGPPRVPRKLVNDSWWRRCFGCETRNILDDYPPLARAYLCIQWYSEHSPLSSANPYHYEITPFIPAITKKNTFELPHRVGHEGEIEFKRSPNNNAAEIHHQAEETDQMLPKPVLSNFRAGLWSQVGTLMFKDLVAVKKKWLMFLIGYILLAASLIAPMAVLYEHAALKNMYSQPTVQIVNQIRYVWAASGIWQVICVGFHVVMTITSLIGERMSGTRDALSAAKCRGAAYYLATFLETFFWALLSGVTGFGCAIGFFNSLQQGDQLAGYYGIACFCLHMSFVFFGCVFSTLFNHQWGIKLVLLIYTANLLPFIANIPNITLDLNVGGSYSIWLFLPAEYILQMYKCISNPGNSQSNEIELAAKQKNPPNVGRFRFASRNGRWLHSLLVDPLYVFERGFENYRSTKVAFSTVRNGLLLCPAQNKNRSRAPGT